MRARSTSSWRRCFPAIFSFGWIRPCTPWRAIRSTVGVRNLICDGELPAAVPQGVVEDIQASAGGDGAIPVAERPPFNPGEEVTVTDGPLRNQIGWFQNVADRERVVILLSMLGRQVPFTVPLAALRHAH